MNNSGTTAYKTSCKDCGSSNAKQVFNKDDGSQDAFCYACETYDSMGNVKTKQIKQEKEVPMDTSSIDKLNSIAIPDRLLRKEVVEAYSVKVALSEQDGRTITHHYYPDKLDGKLIGYEVRNCVDKNFKAIGNRKGSFDLWGQSTAPLARKLFITEGRLDAMSLHQTILDNTPAKYAQYKPAVVSLTRGVTSATKDIIHNKEFLSKYEEVILVLDNDDAGKKATKEILKLLPMAKTAILSEKDASDMLVKGKGKELYQACVWNSQYLRQGEVVDVSDFIENAMERVKVGLTFPWESMTRLTFGIRPHNIFICGAAPKIGKSDFQYQLVHHLVYNQQVKVGIFDLENSPVTTSKRIASKEAKLDFLRPDKVYEDSLLRSTLEGLEGKVRFYDRSGSRDWVDIKATIEELHLLDGINIFCLDPITCLISKFSSSEANDQLNLIMTEMADLVQSYPITIFCFSHVNPKPKSSKSHEQGGRVLSSEFTGSRSLEKWSHYGIGLSRNRTEDCPDEDKNITRVSLLFDRSYGQTGGFNLYFDEDTVTYLEPNTWGR